MPQAKRTYRRNAPPTAGDEQEGGWTRQQLKMMDSLTHHQSRRSRPRLNASPRGDKAKGEGLPTPRAPDP
jgi:hypothetical protein